MNKELQDKLFEKYPLIFQDKDKPMNETCMCWGITTGDGWYMLLDKLCSSLQWSTDRNSYPQVIADQVKEKFGGLRFYYHTQETEKSKVFSDSEVGKRYPRTGEYFDGMIDFACSMSYNICELCGHPGVCNKSGWIRCRCEECKDAS
jgi:hypothetical protein